MLKWNRIWNTVSLYVKILTSRSQMAILIWHLHSYILPFQGLSLKESTNHILRIVFDNIPFMVLEESRTETSSIAWVTGRHEAGNEGRRLSIKSFDDRFITLPGMSSKLHQFYCKLSFYYLSVEGWNRHLRQRHSPVIWHTQFFYLFF